MNVDSYYAGIGSRETPLEIQSVFIFVSSFLAKKNFILRSGGAKGADKSFETGCDKVNGRKEIYLPWFNFENNNSKLVIESQEALEIAKKFHLYWNNLSQGGKKLQVRNTYQVLGQDLNTPSKFIICWTKYGKGEGGTGQAIRIANHYNIPVFDAGKYETSKVKKFLKLFLLKHSELKQNDFL